MEKICVLLSGWKESGKDTAFEFLRQKYGFVRFAFADDLKDDTAEIYPVNRSDMDTSAGKKAPMLSCPVLSTDSFSDVIQREIYTHFSDEQGNCPNPNEDKKLFLDRSKDGYLSWKGNQLYWTIRALLVMEGSVKRTFDPYFWTDIPLQKMKQYDRPCGTDCRYESEIRRTVMLLSSHYRIFVVRIDVDREPTSVDSSERGLDHYDFHLRILNEHNGIEKFHQKLEVEFKRLFGF
jgi:hypothetical protein